MPEPFVSDGRVSRHWWRRPQYLNADARFVNLGTHSAFGGAPTYSSERPLPEGCNDEKDIATAIAVDKFIRTKAIEVGVPIEMVGDYGFEDLPAHSK